MPHLQLEQLKQVPLDPADVWLGGLVRLPGWVAEPGKKPFRTSTAIWMSPVHQKVHMAPPHSPEEMNYGLVLQALAEMATDPAKCGHRPGKVVVANPALAEYLQGTLRDLGIEVAVVEHLPILDALLADFAKSTGIKDPPPLLSGEGVTVEGVRRFAQAATEFLRAKPWRFLDSNEDLIRIEAPAAPPGLQYLTVMGMGGQTFGVSFFDSPAQLDALNRNLDPAKFFAKNGLWSVTFDDITHFPFGDVDLWEDHHLPVEGDTGYPCPMWFGPKNKIRRPDAATLAFMEGVLRMLAATTEEEADRGRWQKTLTTAAGTAPWTLALPDLVDPQPAKPADPLAASPLKDRRFMDRIMADVSRLLEEQDFKSPEEANEFLRKHVTGQPVPHAAPRTPLEKAQDLVWEAMEARGRKRIHLAKQALEISPDCADAYVLLAEHQTSPQEALPLYEQGVKAGERALGQEFFAQAVGQFWGMHETRPYMRARLGLADCLAALDREPEAIEHYQDMLRLNPNDNQGVRDLLAVLLLKTRRDEPLAKLLKAYHDDATALWAYTWALLLFRQKGDSPAAQNQLRKAMKTNHHVAKYLLGKKQLPAIMPETYALGSTEEALFCAQDLTPLWQAEPGAVTWLESRMKRK